ncbi:uridine 5'-monophosphate synthase [Halyomorpha halys]|uniref:uridine 5'-monophosphate synthase n=1 Tax=Halyomorpha halys TaxID=286706 RepID=UPI0006D4F641|nr:uridine 5'-monophosphate synthase [Halyomorpha halys]
MSRLSSEVKEVCGQLYDIGALKFGDFKMKVGLNSPVYFDLRVMVSYPPVMEKLSSLVWKFAESANIIPKVICGVPYTALPVSTIVSIKSGIPMLIRRKEPKKYGTMKLIEGTYSAGDTCLIIEDVVTSGCSILETVKDLRHDGMVVTDAIVIVDREQGGTINLNKNGIKMHSLFTLSEILEVLFSMGKIEQNTVHKVSDYIKDNQIFPDGVPMPKKSTRGRLEQTYSERAQLASCSLSKQLFNLMETKKSNLCIAVDVSNSKDLLRIVEETGEEAVVIKTHYDAVADWDENTEKQLVALSQKMNFIILEDRKYSDIGNTVKLQMDRVEKWADAVTMHSIAGPTLIPVASKPVFLVAQLSSAGNLISAEYTRATIEFAENNGENVIGVVCQDAAVVKFPGLIQLTPGVAVNKGVDALDQQYTTPEEAVLIKGGDLIVVGRAITTSSNPKEVAKELRNKLWSAYEKRVTTS